MQNLYPLFERNRILKKESLISLRDYSFAHLKLEYQEYGQGIVRGCDLSVQGNELAVGPGIIKFGRFICLLMEEEKIVYAPAEKIQFLKLKAAAYHTSPDYVAYRAELCLDSEAARMDNEFELCRFNLRNGAQLRTHYTGFLDLQTEYDTINLIHASWSGLGGSSLAPFITRLFAKNILESENCRPEDESFAYLCLCQSGAVPPAVLTAYIKRRTGNREDTALNNSDIYRNMCEMLHKLGQSGGKDKPVTRERHRIMVD